MINDELRIYQKEAIKIARELMYSQDTINKIRQATSIISIANIMKQARINSGSLYLKGGKSK